MLVVLTHYEKKSGKREKYSPSGKQESTGHDTEQNLFNLNFTN